MKTINLGELNRFLKECSLNNITHVGLVYQQYKKMKKEELQRRIDEMKWLQCIDLPTDEGGIIRTKGAFDHCTEEIANERYGIPLDLKEKTVLDIGAANGYHSFLAERRGADVIAIEPNQGRGDNINCFALAKQVLGSSLSVYVQSLDVYVENHDPSPRDIVFYFGVLYHVKAPLLELEYLSKVTKEYALIETAIGKSIGRISAASSSIAEEIPLWEFRPGFDNDPTNYWYPSLKGLEVALLHVGFKKVEVIYLTPGRERATVKAYK